MTTATAPPLATSTASPRESRPTALVIGGGLAGIAAAIRLSDAGVRVTLVETRQRLGGRATSFTDPSTGQLLDNCQHVLMRCCTSLLHLYDRLGVGELIEWHRRFYFADGRGHLDVLEGDDLPAPAHMAVSLMRFKSLTWGEKIAIARAMQAIMRVGRRRRSQLNAVSFADWLAQQGQPRGAIDKFWATICISALNETPENCAADYALQVFQDGFLCNDQAYEMGLSTAPLVQLYDAAVDAIIQAGGEVRLSTSADALLYDAGSKQIAGLRLGEGETLTADCYLSAVPHDRLAKLANSDMVEHDDRLQSLQAIDVSPILGIHLWLECSSLDKPVMTLPHLALTESPLQWVFNKGVEAPTANAPATQHLHGVVSAAYEWVGVHADDITEMAVGELRKVVPSAAHASLSHARVVKEKRATFSCKPGVEALRPGATGAIANLLLAGDWCKSGWPATMEGATRSGYLAADAVLRRLTPAETSRNPFGFDESLPADLDDGVLYRVIARR